MEKIPYRGRYPSAAQYLMSEDKTYKPRQEIRSWRTDRGVVGERIEITYKLIGMGPASFETYRDSLLLLAYQESMRYNQYRWKYARFEVKLGALRKYKRDLAEIHWFQAASDSDPEVMVYGPGYAIDPDKTLARKAKDVLDIARRYLKKVSKQKPYRVLRLVICIRDTI